jgi:hypothetical protein
MPLVKKRAAETPGERAIRDRVMKAKAKNIRWDRDGRWAEACASLALLVGVDAADLYEEHGERASVRHYLGELDIDEAERLAFEDIRSRFEVK